MVKRELQIYWLTRSWQQGSKESTAWPETPLMELGSDCHPAGTLNATFDRCGPDDRLQSLHDQGSAQWTWG